MPHRGLEHQQRGKTRLTMTNLTDTPAKLTKEERIESHFTTANDHWNKYAFEIYTRVTESGLFADVELPLDAFQYATDLLWNGRNSPLSAVKALMTSFDEQTDPPFTDERKRFMLEHLIDYHRNTIFTDPDNKEYSLDRIVKLLEQEKVKIPKPVKEQETEYDWQATKAHLDTLPDATAKIAHLIEKKAKYNQLGGLKLKGWGPDYADNCQTEIKKLEALAKLEQQGQTVKSPFRLSEKKGAKTNLIRLLNALYELHLIELADGQRPTKAQFMQQVGGFLGVDMNRYEQTLSKALEQPLETNLEVFRAIEQAAQSQVLARLERGQQ
jgi:hypothetical protein